jgi:Heavy metal binding domain
MNKIRIGNYLAVVASATKSSGSKLHRQRVNTMMNRSIRIFVAAFCMQLLIGCATDPPPLAPNNPANPDVRTSSRVPINLLARDETTLAIEKKLSASEADAKSSESMHHDMQNMHGMRHESIKMQHDRMQQGKEMDSHGEMQHGMKQPKQEKSLQNEMKKTSDEMRTESMYTCPMHSQIDSAKPGKCPICGMTLQKKKDGQ